MPKTSSTPGSTKAGRRQRDGKAYRLTCSNCRSRKVKCDGQQPECRICLAYGERCHYDKPPPMSQVSIANAPVVDVTLISTQVLAMQARIDELERRLAATESHPSSEAETTELQARPIPRRPRPIAQQHGPVLGSGSPQSALANTAHGGLNAAKHDSPSYTSTSSIQPPILADHDLDIVGEQLPPILPWNADQLQFWENAAAQAGAAQLNLPTATIAHLLRTHAAWIYPAFMFTVRPYFLRDSACGSGEYSSHLLMATICLHACRFTHRHLQAELSARVQFLLGQSLQHESSIPTVQSLLHLSARDVGRGAWSSAWLYAGMAFRIAVDLGVFTRCRSRDVDPVRRSVYDQLAWACFSWDKAISLYLGRTPSLPEPPTFEPFVLDEQAEFNAWQPCFECLDGQDDPGQSIPAILSHAGSCFVGLCGLSVIINEILLRIYVNKPTDPLPFVQQTRSRLECWKGTLPQHLVLDPTAQQCPPPHTLTLNALYYAATILLHRPFRKIPGCLAVCRAAAEAVERLVVLLENSYGLSSVTYLFAYCAYTAATVAVLDMADGVEGSQRAVNTYLRALYGCQKSCPGIQRSIDIILKAFETGSSAAFSPSRAPQYEGSDIIAAQSDPLPAFPLEPMEDVAQYSSADEFNTVPFGDLDPFAEWSIPMEAFEQYMALGEQQVAF